MLGWKLRPVWWCRLKLDGKDLVKRPFLRTCWDPGLGVDWGRSSPRCSRELDRKEARHKSRRPGQDWTQKIRTPGISMASCRYLGRPVFVQSLPLRFPAGLSSCLADPSSELRKSCVSWWHLGHLGIPCKPNLSFNLHHLETLFL